MKKLKNIKFKSAIVILSLLLFTAACEKWTDPSINIDPDAAADAGHVEEQGPAYRDPFKRVPGYARCRCHIRRVAGHA